MVSYDTKGYHSNSITYLKHLLFQLKLCKMTKELGAPILKMCIRKAFSWSRDLTRIYVEILKFNLY